MSNKEVLLFSGGPDSTVVLQYLLNKGDIDLTVVHAKLVWQHSSLINSQIQKEHVLKIINHYRNKGYKFQYLEPSLTFIQGNTWSDDQWSCFFGAMVCKGLGIDRMWSGYFHYTNQNRINLKGHGHDWAFDGSMQQHCDIVSPDFKIKYTNPYLEFNGTEIDAINNKKEAFEYLDPEVRTMVRSCYASVKFCGTCYKCESLIKNNVTDSKGNLL